MGGSGTSLGIGSELVLRIGTEFGVWSCVTQSHNSSPMHFMFLRLALFHVSIILCISTPLVLVLFPEP